MTFRTRMSLTFLAAAIVPIITLALLVRSEMKQRLTSQYTRRVDAMVMVIDDEIGLRSANVSLSLEALVSDMADDNRFRSAALGTGMGDKQYLLDYAGDAMRLAGLSMLLIQDGEGRIISSGHFRNEYDRVESRLPELLSSTGGDAVIVRIRAAESPFEVLARIDSFEMGGRKFTITGGIRVDAAFLSRLSPDGEMSISLVLPGEDGPGISPAGEGRDGGKIIRGLDVPFIDSGVEGPARLATFSVSHGFTGLEDILRGVDRWFLVAVAAAVLLSIALVSWIASRISRPLAALSRKTREVDLDRLDVDFPAGGDDEIGALSSLLGEMVDRLRAGAVRIRDAEHRATLGEMARQVNHDIKNGLTPIRNVFRHLSELSREAPERLPGVFSEREGTVDSSISYLERLASNYAKLYPSGETASVDLDEVVRRVVGDRAGTPSVDVDLDLCGRAAVVADPLSMRRLVENLAGNAFASLRGGEGRVSVRTRVREEPGGEVSVELEVEDNGCGIAEEKLGMIFDDFYTTRQGGTGLGLSIVRRLVMDLGGEIVVDSEEGKGSVFTVRLPGDRTAGNMREG